MTLCRNLAAAAVVAVVAVACSDKRHISTDGHSIVIDPTVTRASELSFDNGDRIGLTVIKSGEQSLFISNAELTCNGNLFAADGVEWYADHSKTATMRAYYPYDSAGEPATFTVKTDQRGEGYTLSDFMTASAAGVAPTTTAVPMLFHHRMAKINIVITDNSAAAITETGIVSCAVTAAVDVAAGTATAYASSQKAGITARQSAEATTYNAIIPPQSASLTFYVKMDDGSEMRSVAMSATEYAAGRQYTARLTVTDNKLDVSLSGQIEGWGDNTDLTPEKTPDNTNPGGSNGGDTPGGDNNGGDNNGGNNGGNGGQGDSQDPGTGGGQSSSVNWGGVDYPVVTLADGRTWMGANLRYVPAGKTASTAPDDGSGFWYPCNSDKSAVTSESFIAEHGYLYSADVAHGGRAQSGEQAVRGICPEGWHLPTADEFEALRAAYPSAANLVAAMNLVMGGCVNAANAYLHSDYGDAFLWGSSVNDSGTQCLKVACDVPGAYVINTPRTIVGASVRCVKDNN